MPDELPQPTWFQQIRGYSIHLLTASGIFFAFLATEEIVSATCDPRWVFAWLLAAVVVDAIDGPLARRFEVKQTAPLIDGRTIDDLLDYLTFAFIPLLLIARMGWLPENWGWAVTLGMLASLFGFSHVHAKYDDEGFFRGFPSYWNIFAFYAGWISTELNPWITLACLLVLAILTVSPVRVLYPNRALGWWKQPILIGSVIWAVILLVMLPYYPNPATWLVLISLIYPAFYFVASVVCDYKTRTRSPTVE